jgi:NAD(P)-dependent dehydrogenase (short-subunit alcohol dehydrogenase family)
VALVDLEGYLGVRGRTAVVTGALGGVGLAVTEMFQAAGMQVVAVDVLPDEEAARRLPAAGEGRCLYLRRDVGSVQDCEDIVRQALSWSGRVDVLVNAAAILRRIPIDDVSEDDWDEIMRCNLKSQYFLSRAASRPMRERRWGRIVNFSSQGAYTGGFHSSSVYNTAKGGVLTLTRSFARYLAPYGICVNGIAPGGVDTPMMAMPEQQLKEFVAQIPLGRMATPAEMASIVLFLASEAARYITGTILDASGGLLMK